MSVNSVKISQIVLDGVLYNVNVSYKDASGDLFPIANPSNFTPFSENQTKKLHEFIVKSIEQLPQNKPLSSYCSIKIDDQGVFSEGNEKLADMAATISSIWKEAKADLISHFENSTTSILIPLEQNAPVEDVVDLQDEKQQQPRVEMHINRDAHIVEKEQETASDLLENSQDIGTSALRMLRTSPNAQQDSNTELTSILEEASIREALDKEKSNDSYYNELVDAVFNLVITTRKQTFEQFIESLEEVAMELRKNQANQSIKKQISHKLSAQMIEKLKEKHEREKYKYDDLSAFDVVYQRCSELKDASTTLSKASFTNIMQPTRS